jgi:hypothetical protein
MIQHYVRASDSDAHPQVPNSDRDFLSRVADGELDRERGAIHGFVMTSAKGAPYITRRLSDSTIEIIAPVSVRHNRSWIGYTARKRVI